jgi:hypothetical protein
VNPSRIEFVGVTIYGPGMRAFQSWKPQEWPGWTARVMPEAVILEGQGRRIDLPRSACVLYFDALRAEASEPIKVDGRTKEAKAMKAQGAQL